MPGFPCHIKPAQGRAGLLLQKRHHQGAAIQSKPVIHIQNVTFGTVSVDKGGWGRGVRRFIQLHFFKPLWYSHISSGGFYFLAEIIPVFIIHFFFSLSFFF